MMTTRSLLLLFGILLFAVNTYAQQPSTTPLHPAGAQTISGEVLKIDIGARASGYCSDMTRTVCFGEPRDARLVELHGIVLEAQEQAEAQLRPGMTGREGDSLSRDVIARAGYGEAFAREFR